MTLKYIINTILRLHICWRAVLFGGICFLLWLIFSKPLLKIVSIIPYILKKILYGLYLILECPISMLHSKFGSFFGTIDNGLSLISEKGYVFLNKLYDNMKTPKTLFLKQIFIVYLILCAYLLIPMWLHLNEKPFTFWQNSYITNEEKIIQWMENKGWFEN